MLLLFASWLLSYDIILVLPDLTESIFFFPSNTFADGMKSNLRWMSSVSRPRSFRTGSDVEEAAWQNARSYLTTPYNYQP